MLLGRKTTVLRSCEDCYNPVTAHSWLLYSAATVGVQVTGNMDQYPTVTISSSFVTSPYPTLLMLNARLGNGKNKINNHLFDLG